MDTWDRVLSVIGKRVSPHCYETWFRPLALVALDADCVRICAPNENFRQWFLDHYAAVVADAIRDATGLSPRLDVTVAAAQPAVPLETPSPQIPAESTLSLNHRYTFDTFVVGTSNQFARAAAMAVSEQPARAYNPLYIYGGVGLGKTHLLHAIGHVIRRRFPRMQVSYLSAEQFMNEVVNSIRFDRTMQFRQKYRNIDVLLMDDIEFIAGKERTQEEFFHTFNALYNAQKQIVITSDCHPREIATIEERLHSRFEWGLIADIQAPDLETKIAILRKKAESLAIPLSDAVVSFLASSVRSSIRELEGALLRVSARASFDGIAPTDIDTAYAREVLKRPIVDEARPVTTETIIQAVSEYFGLKPAQLKARDNSRPIVQPRQIAMYIAKRLTRQSLPQIGREFGGKHHTTVLHSIRKIDDLKNKDAEISEALSNITRSIS
ncbi:MAG: chromosomal replication initiator protein DnaA [Acidobacteria bacterium]|nr:chromosomal replication initiator protein DnaA [Acidobacteriota bacterium]